MTGHSGQVLAATGRNESLPEKGSHLDDLSMHRVRNSREELPPASCFQGQPFSRGTTRREHQSILAPGEFTIAGCGRQGQKEGTGGGEDNLAPHPAGKRCPRMFRAGLRQTALR